MSAQGETMGAYFRLDDPRQADECAHALAQSDALKSKRALPAALHEPAAKALIWALKNLLNDPVSETLAKAWAKAREIKKFADAPPDQVNETALHEHDIALVRKPAVELVLNGAPTGLQFEFELKMGLVVEGALIKIQGRRIVGARLSAVLGSGSISCGKITIAERKSSSVALPGELSFAPGIAIPA
jgi:hypothetical protein